MPHAELVGGVFPCSLGYLIDCLRRQPLATTEMHEPGHVIPPVIHHYRNYVPEATLSNRATVSSGGRTMWCEHGSRSPDLSSQRPLLPRRGRRSADSVSQSKTFCARFVVDRARLLAGTELAIRSQRGRPPGVNVTFRDWPYS